MPSVPFKLGLIVLAALVLRIEAQTTRLSGLRPSRGLDKHGLHNRLQDFVMSSEKRCGISSCGVRRGSSPYDKPDKFLGYTMTDSQETTLNATREDRFQARDLLKKPRKRRWISKRKLKKQLQECEARLHETQDTLDAPRLLFIQMAQHCTLERAAGRYYFRTTDMDADTYVFTEMPLQQANVLPTSYFVGYLFDEFFPVEKPNAAFTFNVYNNQSEKTFEGPLISVLLSSHQFILQEDNSTLVVYELAQSSEQEEISRLSRFFRGADPLSNASVTYEHCSLFIDPASEHGADSYHSAAESRDDTADALNRAAQAVENGPAQTALSDAIQTYSRVWNVKERETNKTMSPKDVYKDAADSMRELANLIKECKGSDCWSKNLESMISVLLKSSTVIGAVFAPTGAARTIVASIGLVFSSFFYDPPDGSSDNPNYIDFPSPSMINFNTGLDPDCFLARYDECVVFEMLDLDTLVRRTGSLAYIRNQKKGNSQAQIDEQVKNWKTQEFTGAWKKSQTALDIIHADYDKWFGTVSGKTNSRIDVVNWINDNANKCRVTDRPQRMTEGTNYDQYPPPVYHSSNVDSFQNCLRNVEDGSHKWDGFMKFAQRYRYIAAFLMNYASQATVIMQMTSFCDPTEFDEDTINAKCAYNDDIQNMLSKVFLIQSHALFLQRVFSEIPAQCQDRAGWPFSQSCSINNPNSLDCNYKWGISLPRNTYINVQSNLEKIGFSPLFGGGEVKPIGEDDDSINDRIPNRFGLSYYDSCATSLQNSEVAYGGLWAYTVELAPFRTIGGTFKFPRSLSSCGLISEKMGRHYVFGAVPNYALKPDLPQCAALVDDPSLWGPNFSSDERLKRYTPNLRCRSTSVVSRHFNSRPEDQINECWSHCYNEAKLRPIFFFAVIEASLVCECFSSCDIMYQKGSSLFAALEKPSKS